MRIALLNPCWSFDGSIYFGCREPHLPLEYGYSRSLLEEDGHEVAVIDAPLLGLDRLAVRRRIEAFTPDITVVTTAPSYLFWRCPPPELRVPLQAMDDLNGVGGAKVVVGPHASTSPVTTVDKLGADAAVLGECEEVLRALARARRDDWREIPSLAVRGDDGTVHVNGGSHTTNLNALPPLAWSDEEVAAHRHHHHRFDGGTAGPGAEIEASRGCPFRCTFCAKQTHRDRYRKRPLEIVTAELDLLIAQGVEYVYFIDEIFLPDRPLLEALATRRIWFGVQTRIDLWSLDMLDLLGRAGCVSIEAGVESITPAGREGLDKRCRLDTNELAERLIHARRTVPFVQATLMESSADDPDAVAAWRGYLREQGVWANDPVPLFPYPGSPDYTRLWGRPDERAWDRAHAYYLGQYDRFSDIQNSGFVHLPVLEQAGAKP